MWQNKVSIIIPTFNRANLLPVAIEASLRQTYPCEIIVCDHGSRDNTPAVVQRYGDHVRYIRREEDMGPHFCWLDGILHASGDLIHIQYDDDWIATTFIEKTVALMADDVGLVVTGVEIVKEDGNQKAETPDKLLLPTTGIYNGKIFSRYLMKGGMVSPGSCLFRRTDALDALYQGRLPTNRIHCYHGVGPDHFMSFLPLLFYPKFGYCAEHLAFFRAHANSITIEAQQNEKKAKQLEAAYYEVKIFYQLLLFYQQHSLFRAYLRRAFTIRRIKSFLRMCYYKLAKRKTAI